MSGWPRCFSSPACPCGSKAHVVQEEKGPKLVAQEIASLETALPRLPERLDVRLQAATVTREQLLKLKEILSRHGGPVPVFLHFLHPREGASLALPKKLALTPSPELISAVNRLFGYPALTL